VGLKEQGHEADNSPTSRAKVKSGWSFSYTS